MREAQGNPRKQQASPRHQAKDESNLTARKQDLTHEGVGASIDKYFFGLTRGG